MKLVIKKRDLRAVLVLVGFIFLGVLIFALVSHWEAKQDAETADPYSDGRRTVIYNDATYALREDLRTVLLIGVDKFVKDISTDSYNNSQQADFLLLLVLDSANKSYKVLHLNRDTMTEINILGVRGENAGSFTGQLALSHTYGSGGRDSCRNTAEAVSNLLYGTKIDHFIAFTMDAVSLINDKVGGVELTMPDDLSSLDPAMSEGAVVNLLGEQALFFVRARGGLSDSTNLNRMERQKLYLNALALKLRDRAAGDDAFLLGVVKDTSQYIVSDYTVEQLSSLFRRASSYENSGIFSPSGEASVSDIYMEFRVDEADLRALVVDTFYERCEDATE